MDEETVERLNDTNVKCIRMGGETGTDYLRRGLYFKF